MTNEEEDDIGDSSSDFDEDQDDLDEKVLNPLLEKRQKLLTPQRQIDRVLEMMDEQMIEFDRRCTSLSSNLETLDREVTGNINLIKEYLNFAKDEMDLELNEKCIGKTGYKPVNLDEYVNKIMKDPFFKLIVDDKNKALFLLIASHTTCFQEKIKILFSSKELYKIRKRLLKKYILPQFKKEINKIKNKSYVNLKKKDIDLLNDMVEYPNITALQGLDFLDEKRENSLKETNDQNIQVLKMICACLNERYNYKIVIEGYDFLFKKYKVKSIKNLFKNVILKKVFTKMIDSEIEEIAPIIQAITPNRDVIAENLIKNLQNPFSFVAESLDEIDSFLSNLLIFDDDMKDRYKNLLYAKKLEKHYNKLKLKVGLKTKIKSKIKSKSKPKTKAKPNK